MTLFDKLWEEHEVEALSERQSLLYVDRIFLHERTGSVALNSLLEHGRSVRQRQHAFCTMDHIVDTRPGRSDDTLMPSGRDFIVATRSAAHQTGIQLFDIQDPNQGIVHVISPELGIALPGLSVICPDSHTCTLGGSACWPGGWGQPRQSMPLQRARFGSLDRKRCVFSLWVAWLSMSPPKISFSIRSDRYLRRGVRATPLSLQVLLLKRCQLSHDSPSAIWRQNSLRLRG